MTVISIALNSADKARHCTMLSLVERMLELHKQSPRSPLDKERLGRVPGKPPGIIKIEPAADRAIDRLVYELSRKGMIYGLS